MNSNTGVVTEAASPAQQAAGIAALHGGGGHVSESGDCSPAWRHSSADSTSGGLVVKPADRPPTRRQGRHRC